MQADDILDAPAADQTLIYSKFWHRVVAAVIDIIVAGGFNLFIVLTYPDLGFFLLNVAALAFGFFYFIVTVAVAGATPGKMVMGMRIVKADGTPATWGSAFLRYIVAFTLSFFVILPYLLAFVFPSINPDEWVRYDIPSLNRQINLSGTVLSVWNIACMIFIAANKQRRAPYDFIAGTVVIRVRLSSRHPVIT